MPKSRKKWGSIILIVFLVVGGLIFFRQFKHQIDFFPAEASENIGLVGENKEVHRSYSLNKDFYDLFFEGVVVDPVEKHVVSGVIPHHLVAGKYLAQFFEKLKDQKPSVVVLIGPNHPQTGPDSVVTSKAVWQSPYGDVVPNTDLVDKLISENVAVVNEKIMSTEHSISALIPFIKHTWGNTKVVPLIIKNNTPTSTLRTLAEKLQINLPANSLVLASVDFSHYLPLPVASFHDELSRNVLAVGDVDRTSELEVDSIPSLYFLLYYNQLQHAQDFQLVTSTNSASITGKLDLPETTSHILGFFTDGRPTETPLITIQFFGDIMLDRNVAKNMGSRGLDYLFEHLKGKEERFFSGMNLLIANLEGPFAPNRVPTTKSIAFRFDPKLALQLKKYGFSGFSSANNHSLDMGWKNVDVTAQTLDAAGLGHFGMQIKENKDLTWVAELPGNTDKVAFIGLNNTDHPLDMPKVYEAIKDAREKARYVIVFMHWGVEYQRISRQQERDLAHTLLDQGASAVIGAHPHVIEEMELYKGKPIFYSLGNFIFDQYFSTDTQEGLSVGLVLQDGGVKNIYAFPMYGEVSQVQLMEGDRQNKFFDWFNKNSRINGKEFVHSKIDL